MGGDPQGDGVATCKIAGVAYEGPTNLALTPNSVEGPGRSTRTGRYGLDYDRSQRPRIPSAAATGPLVQSAATTGVAWPAWGLHGGRWHQGEQGPTEPGVVPTASCPRGSGSSGPGGAVVGYSLENGSICAA